MVCIKHLFRWRFKSGASNRCNLSERFHQRQLHKREYIEFKCLWIVHRYIKGNGHRSRIMFTETSYTFKQPTLSQSSTSSWHLILNHKRNSSEIVVVSSLGFFDLLVASREANVLFFHYTLKLRYSEATICYIKIRGVW